MPTKVKTIFIPIFQGVEAKSILRTDIYKELSQRKDIRLVVLVLNNAKKEYFQKEFFADNVIYEVIDFLETGWLENLFSQLKVSLLRTVTMDLKRKVRLKETKNYFQYYISFIFNRIFARKIFQKLFRYLNSHLLKDKTFDGHFDKYQPQIVFSAHLFGDNESTLASEAKRRGIKVIGFINSWDKMTARCILRVLPDRMIVPNNIVKSEVLMYTDMNPENVLVTGIPSYDYLVREKPNDKELFYKRIGADPKKEIILYAPAGKSFSSDADRYTLETLKNIYEAGLISEDVQFLVRFQPNDDNDGISYKNSPMFLFDLPGKRFSSKRGVDWDMSSDDLHHLLDTLYYSRLVITHVSSILIDGAIFDKPIILVDLEDELQKKRKQGLARTMGWRFFMDHFVAVTKTSGVRWVRSTDDLVKWINSYLQNPGLDRDGRRQIINEQCWKLDGLAGQRVAGIILNEMGQ